MEVPYRLFGQTGASQDFAMKEILFIEKKSHISIQMSSMLMKFLRMRLMANQRAWWLSSPDFAPNCERFKNRPDKMQSGDEVLWIDVYLMGSA